MNTLTVKDFLNGGIYEPEKIISNKFEGLGLQEIRHIHLLLEDLYSKEDLRKYASDMKIYFNPNTGEVYAKGKGIRGSFISPDGGNNLVIDWEIKGIEEPFKWERKK